MRLTLRVLGRRMRRARACAREGAQDPHRPADSTTTFFLLLKVGGGDGPPSGLVWKQLYPSAHRGLGSPNESLPATERRADLKTLRVISN